ncbi:MAG: wax ester/triacylglycerol synthase family O-acyltransferase [Aeromicrobium sp.]
MDAGFLYMETPSVHMHTLKIAILEGNEHLTWDNFTQAMMARLKRLPPLRRRAVEIPFGLNHPVWVTMSRIDPKSHIIRHRVPGDGTMRDLEELIGRISSNPLDRRFPLWELHFCEGLEGGRTAIVGKLHHALADGGAANALLGNVTDVRSADLPATPDDEYDTADRVPAKLQLMRDGLRDALIQSLSLPALIKRTVSGLRAVIRYRRNEGGGGVPRPVLDAPRVSINGALTRKRTFATVTLPLSEFKRIRLQHDEVTLNDLVLAVVSGALRQWLVLHDEHPSSSLTAGVPVGIDERDAAPRLGGNRLSNMFTTLATDIDDPTERLQTIARTTRHAKEIQNRMGKAMMSDWTQFAPPRPFAFLVRTYSKLRAAQWHPSAFTAIVSNVPGPREPATIGGTRLSGLFSVGPLADGIGLNATVWSYVDKMNFSLLACPDLLPDVEVLATFFPGALAELDLDRESDLRQGTDQDTLSDPRNGQATA